MKVSLSWLQDYVSIETDIRQLADMLTMAGLEVEAIEDRFDFLHSVLVARIAAVEAHPNADKLKLCRVQAGGRNHEVVCGAPNAAAGMLAPLALPGSILPNGMRVSESVIRGQASQGMLCSAAELTLSADRSGLMELEADLKPGTPLNKALGLSDPVLEIGLTPNRSDCLSIIGVAREIAGFQGVRVKRPALALTPSQEDVSQYTSVVIEAPEHCPRYAARLLDNIKVGPSPFWLQDRLISVGLRPINNLVDITNYVMMESGQPLHAFDLDRLAQNRIVVRTAQAGEMFTTLDGKQRRLESDMLMICDGEKPVAVGGVMGGLNSEIEEGTQRVLIESAYFNPVSIRKTAKRLGLNTDASHRFERGVDPEGTLYALDRAAQLMVELGGGRLIGGAIDVQYQLPKAPAIALSVAATNRLLGTALQRDAIAELLRAIGFTVESRNDDLLNVQTPSFRVDISRPQDLMEEVARRSGYDNIPVTFPIIQSTRRAAPKPLTQRQRIRTLLSGQGFAEAINYSFIHKASGDRLQLPAEDNRRQAVEILNPLSEEQSVMRTSLVPGLLESMQRNLARQWRTLKVFEIGKIFIGQGPTRLPQESEILAVLWTGDREPAGWHTKPVGCDYYDLKGVVEALLDALKVPVVRFLRQPDDQCSYTRAGATARILADGRQIGLIGEIDPRVLEAYDLKQSAFIFEIDLQQLLEQIPDAIQSQPLPKYPATTRDATLIVDRSLEADTILEQVRLMQETLVEDVQLFDVYQGPSIAQNRKSISLRITYRSTETTLEDEAVNQLHAQITERLVADFKADLPT